MKHHIVITFILFATIAVAQPKKIAHPLTPCNETADAVEGIYTDHTNPKYEHSMKGTAAEKAAMAKNLIAIEKLEEASRKGFQLTGCAARVSFSGGDRISYGKQAYNSYGYQLGVYQYVCHIKEHVTKIVDEYRTVLRIEINPDFPTGAKAGGTGEFSINGRFRYEIPVEAKLGPDYEIAAKNNPSRISKYISESIMLTNRSSDYKNKHDDFLKINNGEGYTENWMTGDKYDKRPPDAYQWIDRRYLITRPGVPLLIPVSRKQYLEDMLEYLEIEAANFYFDNAAKIKQIGNNTAEWATRDIGILEEDKRAYPKISEAKKAKIKELLAKQSPEWLQRHAVVDNNNRTYDANKRLEAVGKFYDAEDEYTSALYIMNPEYFNQNNGQSEKPLFIEVQFRYELGKDRAFSERLFNNFQKRFDFQALRQMLSADLESKAGQQR